MFRDKDFMCAVTPQGRMRLSGAGRGRSGVGGGPVKARRRKMASNGPKAVRRRGSPTASLETEFARRFQLGLRPQA